MEIPTTWFAVLLSGEWILHLVKYVSLHKPVCKVCGFFLSCVYIYCPLISSYQDGRVGFPLSGLASPYFCVCSNPGSAFPTPYMYVMAFFLFFSAGEGQGRLLVFVDICRIIDHNNLNYLFIKCVFLWRFRKTILSVLINWFVWESDILS